MLSPRSHAAEVTKRIPYDSKSILAEVPTYYESGVRP